MEMNFDYEALAIADDLMNHNTNDSLTPIAGDISIGAIFSSVKCREWTISVGGWNNKEWSLFFGDKKVIYINYPEGWYSWHEEIDGLDKDKILEMFEAATFREEK